MTKVIHFPRNTPAKFGFKKARVKKRRKKPDLEDMGQLNLFDTGKVIDLKPKRSAFDEALFFDENGKTDKAKEAYIRAIDNNENLADAYCNLGILHSSEGNSGKAMDAFTQCLKLDPRHFEAHYNLANQFSEIGNVPLAKAHYQMSITINPEFSNGYYNLGLLHAMEREYEEAMDNFVKYKDTAPLSEKQNAMDLIRSLSNSIAN